MKKSFLAGGIIILLFLGYKGLFTPQVIEPIIITDTSGILLGDEAKYENLSIKNKLLIEKIYDPSYFFNDPFGYKLCQLKYFDTSTVLVGCVAKVGIRFFLVKLADIKPFDPVLDTINTWAYVETKNLLISIQHNNITYFKPGFIEIKRVTGSELTTGETYVKRGGMADDYEFSFDEATKILTVSVFKNEQKEDRANTKLREVKFILN